MSRAARRLAWEGLTAVLLEGRSLSAVLPALQSQCDPRERPLLHKLLHGTLRWKGSLDALLTPLLDKPLRRKDADVALLLQLGLYQLHCMDGIPPHAAVNETVKLLPRRKQWARGLINGVLRRFARTDDATKERWLAQSETGRYSHPQWLIDRIREDWPDHWRRILEANDRDPPLTLRTNALKTNKARLLEALAEADCPAKTHPAAAEGIVIRRATDVRTLPGYAEGWFAVQDAAAQQAAPLLAPKPGERILDACAAPGGKTAHIQALAGNHAEVLAVEKSAERLERLYENLDRLGCLAQVRHGDAAQPSDWWDGRPFDRILLDAPCSASGIIRRHPDVKWHRTPEDIERLGHEQLRILNALWPLLKPGGTLLYATCSILKAENDRPLAQFLDAHGRDARIMPLPARDFYAPMAFGCAILPGSEDMDGFAYTLLRKE